MPAVVASREAENLRALDALVAVAGLRELLQARELHTLEGQDVLLGLRTAASVVPDHPVRAHDAVARDEVRDRVVGKRRAHRPHRERVADLARDPSIWADLAPRNLQRLVQHRLGERPDAAKVEPHPALAGQLVLDLGGEIRGWLDANEPPADIAPEPVLELGR